MTALDRAKADVLAEITQNGPKSTVELAAMFGYSTRTTNAAIRELRAQGLLSQQFAGWIKEGSLRLFVYDLPKKIHFPKIGAGSYRGWRPSGTDPNTIKRLNHVLLP